MDFSKIDEITLLSWNVNGIRALYKKNAFLKLQEYDSDILCLQEIKASEENIPTKLNKEYNNVFINSGIVKGKSGTLTYSNLTFDRESFCSEVDTLSEGRVIEQYFKNIVLMNVYIPNGKSSKERLKIKIDFLNRLFIYCEKLKKKGKSIILCGDFNTAHKDIDLKKTKIANNLGFSDEERDCINIFIKKGYIDTYRHIHGNKEESYTWWSYRSKGREKNEGWRIDYIFISEDLKSSLNDAFILDCITGSDHCPIGIKLRLPI